jgi:hypothetical protein
MKHILTILFAAAFFVAVVAIAQEQPKKAETKPTVDVTCCAGKEASECSEACGEGKECSTDSEACADGKECSKNSEACVEAKDCSKDSGACKNACGAKETKTTTKKGTKAPTK